MKMTVLLVMIGRRKESATDVQNILKGFGNIIKTRLRIPAGAQETPSDSGLIILELLGDEENIDSLVRKLSLVFGIKIKLLNMTLDEEY